MCLMALAVVFSIHAGPFPDLNDNGKFKYERLTEGSDMVLVHNLEFDRYGLMSGGEKILPIRFKSVKIDKRFGSIEGSEVWALRLCGESLITEDELEPVAAELRKIHPMSVIITEDFLGKSIFDIYCREICARELRKAYCHNDRLCVLTNSEETLVADIRESSAKQFGSYDRTDANKEGNFDDDELLVLKDGLWGVYKVGVGEVVPPRYDYVRHASEGEGNMWNTDYLVYKSDQCGLYSADDGELVPPRYDRIARLAGHICVFLDGKKGIYTYEGRKILEASYKWAEPNTYYGTPDYYGAVTAAGNGVIVNSNGRVVLNTGPTDKFEFDEINTNKYCAFYKGNKVGFINFKKMKVVIPCRYNTNVFWGNGEFPTRKLGVYKESPKGTLIDIWTLNGQKIASKYFPSGTSRYKMKSFLENHLNISLYF